MAWTTADVVILCIAAFIAVTSLVRLMLHRRVSLVRELHEQAQQAKASKLEVPAPASKK